MPVFGKIYLDTNILIAAFEITGEVSARIGDMLRADSKSRRFATSELTLSELLVKPYREANKEAIASYEMLIRSNQWLEVLSVDRKILQRAALLRSRFRALRLPDALHVSTAFAAGCTHFLTADGGLKDSYEIGPPVDGLPAATNDLAILRPDEPTLNSLIKSLSA